jgi:hypothetical protein
MLLVFALGLVLSAVISTRETRQEAVLSTPEMRHEEAMDLQEEAQEAIVGIFLDEANDWLLVFVPLAVASFALIWLIGAWSLRPSHVPRGRPRRSARQTRPAACLPTSCRSRSGR